MTHDKLDEPLVDVLRRNKGMYSQEDVEKIVAEKVEVFVNKLLEQPNVDIDQESKRTIIKIYQRILERKENL